MAKHRRYLPDPAVPPPELPGVGRAFRQSAWFGPLTVTAVTALLTIVAYAPLAGAFGERAVAADESESPLEAGQQLDVTAAGSEGESRSDFTVIDVSRIAPAAGSYDPDSAQFYAARRIEAMGWGSEHFDCVVALWQKESNWRVTAENPTSGAYGIPQALPGDKMASAGSDWRTNYETQVDWGLGYIKNRYGSPCDAWSHSQRKGWY